MPFAASKRVVWASVAALLGIVFAGVWWVRSSRIEDRVYRIGYNHNPPFNWMAENGEPTGFAVETVSLAAKRSGIRLEWVYDESLAAQKLRTGEVDLWPLYADLPERRSFAYISDPWVLSDNFLIVRGAGQGLPKPNFPGEIFYSGPVLYRQLINKRWPSSQLRQMKDPPSLYEPFCSGQAAMVFVSTHQANAMLRELQRMCPETPLQAYNLPDLTFRLGVGSRLDSAAVARRLRGEILAMGEDGAFGMILARYAYIGLTEMRTILQMFEAERQSRTLKWLLAAVLTSIPVMVWLIVRLRRARRAAEMASISKSEFLANMSHEIRTPLGGVIGMVELALECDPMPPQQRNFLETAQSSARTLLALLNDILDFSKIEARRLDVTPVPVDIRELIASVEGLLAPAARGKDLRFTAKVAPDVPEWISVDPVRFRQVVLNLCGNAIKFTPQGSVSLSLGAGPTPGTIDCEVRDTGIGIEAGKQSAVFNAFEQADGSIARNFGGAGLGLAISRQLVELMGGSISLRSQPGIGSAFSFTIPAPATESAAAGMNPVDCAGPQRLLPPPMRILLAEDNPVNQKLIATMLDRDGHTVTIAESGKKAVEIVAGLSSACELDAVLMDIQMPEMDGFQAARAIRGLPEEHPARNVPIVALTAHAQAGYEKICLAAGMNGYLSKPIDRKLLRLQLASIAPATASVQDSI